MSGRKKAGCAKRERGPDIQDPAHVLALPLLLRAQGGAPARGVARAALPAREAHAVLIVVVEASLFAPPGHLRQKIPPKRGEGAK